MEQIKTELSQTKNTLSETLFPPYNEDDRIKIKLNKAHQALIRSIKIKSRTLALTNAYSLGLLLNDIDPVVQSLKKKISRHYRHIAETVYDIFESNPSHLLYTTSIDVQMLSKLKRNQVLELRELVQKLKLQNIFDGAQNLVVEDC